MYHLRKEAMYQKLKKRTLQLHELTEVLRKMGCIALSETIHEVRAPGCTYSQADPNRLEILFNDEDE